MTKQSQKEKISITIDLDIHAKVVKEADTEVRSISQQINKILRDYYKEK